MTCKHGSNSIICRECDLEVIEKNTEALTDKQDPFPSNPAILEVVEKPESALEVTSGNVVTTMIEQPQPKFTLIDLETALASIFKATLAASKQMTSSDHSLAATATAWAGLKDANSSLQELIAAVNQVKNNLDVIELPSDNNKAITDVINTEKPEFSVCGVNLYENGKLVGTSLYTTVVKARKIRDILNSKFAELRVNHEARITNYPVY